MERRIIPVLRSHYRILNAPGDKRVTMTIPIELFEDLQKMADFNKRCWKEELYSRLRATFLNPEELMVTEQILVMIHNKKLAVPNVKPPKKQDPKAKQPPKPKGPKQGPDQNI